MMIIKLSVIIINIIVARGRGPRKHCVLPVSVQKHTPPDKKTGWKFSFENTKSGAGLQLLLLGRMAKARAKGIVCSQTPVP